MRADKRLLQAHLLLLTVGLIYGGNYIVAKAVMDAAYIRPLGFVLLRAATACVLFWLLLASRSVEKIRRRDVPRLLLCGLTGVVINQSFFFSGLERTTPIHASLIMTICPVLVLILSAVLLREFITLRKITGILLGCGGAVLLITTGSEVELHKDYLTGDLMILTNAMSYAVYLIALKPLTRRYHPVSVITWVFTIGFVCMIPVGGYQLVEIQWQTFTWHAWAGVAYVLIFVTFLAYLFNITALRLVSPSVVSVYIYVQPLFAAMLSLILAFEVLTWTKAISAVLIFAGVYLVSVSGIQRMS